MCLFELWWNYIFFFSCIVFYLDIFPWVCCCWVGIVYLRMYPQQMYKFVDVWPFMLWFVYSSALDHWLWDHVPKCLMWITVASALVNIKNPWLLFFTWVCSHECVVVELVSYISGSIHDIMFKINWVSESVDGSVSLLLLLLLRQHRVLIGSFGRANWLCLCPSLQ